MKRNQKKILITGGGGFVGNNLVKRLQDEREVICLDRGDNNPRLGEFFNHQVKIIKGDITDELLLDKIVKDCDAIIHLAGGGGNPACINDPIWAVKTHILGTQIITQKALKYQIKKFIFASSQSVYTTFHKRNMPFKESSNLEPDDYYGVLKAVAEKLIIDSGINYSILRFANIYGVNQLDPRPVGGAINNFINSAFKDQQIKIYGTGEQGIDYLNVLDAVNAIVLAVKGSGAKDINNAGSGRLVKIKDIAQTISDIFEENFNQEIKTKKMPAPADKIWPDRLMSIKKIKQDLNWKPKIALRQGLMEMITNYQK